jgi:hypothetical protein
MSEASRAREAIRKARPVKHLLVLMTPTPEGKSELTIHSDMSVMDLQRVTQALPTYIERKLEAEMDKADKILVMPNPSQNNTK